MKKYRPVILLGSLLIVCIFFFCNQVLAWYPIVVNASGATVTGVTIDVAWADCFHSGLYGHQGVTGTYTNGEVRVGINDFQPYTSPNTVYKRIRFWAHGIVQECDDVNAGPFVFFIDGAVPPNVADIDDDSDIYNLILEEFIRHGGDPCAGKNSAVGMPVWRVSQPYISLWLLDQPSGYQPALGPRVSFDLAFRQRESTNGFDTNIFSVGKNWSCSWLSYVTKFGGIETVNLPGGGRRVYFGAVDYLTRTRLVGDTSTGFTVFNADGSKDVFQLIVTNDSGIFQKAFLTERWNAQNQKTVLQYYSYDPADPVIRLRYVIDGDGRTNSLFYTNNSYSTNLVREVVDPFGRSAFLRYDDTGHLTNVIDVAGISNSIVYDSNGWPSSLTTPYGTTGFAITDTTGTNVAPNGRSILVTEPDGGRQLFVFTNNAPGIVSSFSTNEVPVTGSSSNTFDNAELNVRNSFHWGRLQYANLSTTNISSLTANDFRLARMKHWLKSHGTVTGSTLSMQRDPSPDVGGSIEGRKIWYDYFGKTNAAFDGGQSAPLFVATVLPDGSTHFVRTTRNELGYPLTKISTYSSNNFVVYRTNKFAYATNNFDLIAATNALGVRVISNYFNAYHQVLTNFNALNEKAVYTYDSSNRLSTVTRASGLVTTNTYGSDGFLANRIDIGFATNSFTWSNDLVYTHTDTRGLTVTNTWDALQRLTSQSFPDGTYTSNRYTILDLTATKDRSTNWTYFGFDSLRHNTSITNALGNVTLFDYCSCGSLNWMRDAQSNYTYFYYDNAGRMTNSVSPDGYSVTNHFDLLGRITNTVDSAGTSVTNWFNNQGSQIAVSNSFGQAQSVKYDILDRITNSVDANGVTVATTFDNLNRPLTRSYPDGGIEKWGYTLNLPNATSYTNQLNKVTRFGYDAALRRTSETNANNEVTQFTFNGANDLLTLEDGKNQVTEWVRDEYGRPTNKIDAAENLVFIYEYDANSRLLSQWTPAKGNKVFAYDAIGNVTNVQYDSNDQVTFWYDSLNRMTNMTDAIGTTKFLWNSVGQLLSEDGPWSNDTVSYSYANRQRSSLTLLQPNASAWVQTYAYDLMKRMTNVTSSAGAFDYEYVGSRPSTLVSRLALPNGAYITNNFDGNARLLGTVLKNSSDTILNSHLYHVNVGNQRTAMTNFAGDYRNYTYDDIGQLETALGYESAGAARLHEKFGYTYDAAHNLNQRTNNALVQTFNVNNLNELTTATRGGTLTVAGTTTSPATSVTVNGSAASIYSDNTFAKDGFTVADGDNTFTAIAQDSYGRKDTNSVTVNLPAIVTFVSDGNGNLTSDGGRGFEFDDENQLVLVTKTNEFKKEFVYDGLNRLRIRREYRWSGSAWTKTNEIRFICDGNLAIQHRDENNLPTLTLTRGLDLSGSLEGAGGIGGLLAFTEPSTINPRHFYYHSDGNGNVTALMNTNQIIVARCSYDSFGETLSLSGTSENPYWFSSQLYDADTGFYHYPRRVYVPAWQRFLNRDPIGELGGINLFVFAGNDPTDGTDPLGLSDRPVTYRNSAPNFYYSEQLYYPPIDLGLNLGPIRPSMNPPPPSSAPTETIGPAPMNPNMYSGLIVGAEHLAGTPMGEAFANLNANLYTTILSGGPCPIAEETIAAEEIGSLTYGELRQAGVNLTDRMSGNQFRKLMDSIKETGLQDKVINFVKTGDENYVVLGNNRLQAARKLGITDQLIFKEVQLPFRGFKTENDVINAASEVMGGH